MRLIVDRFEGEYAVCEDENKNMVSILKAELPEDAQEGSVLQVNDGSVTVDREETDNRKRRIKGKMDGMWDK